MTKLNRIKSPAFFQSGFSLLEAVVAISIMAGFGMAIFGWINTNLLTINKIEQRAHKDRLIRSSSAYMQDIDIFTQPNGRKQLAQYYISWRSTLAEPIVDGHDTSGDLSEFQLGLYDTHVELHLNDEKIVFFDVRLVGYKKVRDFQNVF